MAVEITAPENSASAIITDLKSRRGSITGSEHRAGSFVVHAIVPLAEMLGYTKRIRSTTVECSMQFVHYAAAPSRGEPGGDEAEVTANLTQRPKSKA